MATEFVQLVQQHKSIQKGGRGGVWGASDHISLCTGYKRSYLLKALTVDDLAADGEETKSPNPFFFLNFQCCPYSPFGFKSTL